MLHGVPPLHGWKFGRSGGAECPESLYCAARQDAPRGTPAPIKQSMHGFQFPLVAIAAAVRPPASLETEFRTSRIHPKTDPRLQLLPCPAVPPPLLRARPNARQESEHLPDRKRCHVSECVALRAVAELVGHPRRAGQTQLSPVRSTSASAKACIRKEWRIVNAWQR